MCKVSNTKTTIVGQLKVTNVGFLETWDSGSVVTSGKVVNDEIKDYPFSLSYVTVQK